MLTRLECLSTTRKPSTRVRRGTLQSLQSPRKARVSRSKIKYMLICFIDIHGIVHKEFVSQGQTINVHFYREVLKNLLNGHLCEIKRQEQLDITSQ